MSKQSEDNLIALLKEGDLTAFNVLFNAFYYQLYFYSGYIHIFVACL